MLRITVSFTLVAVKALYYYGSDLIVLRVSYALGISG